MQRQIRYTVIKHTDAAKHLTDAERRLLDALRRKVDKGRTGDGKPNFECVVVEHDWPEYRPTWRAIGIRVDAESKTTLSKKFPGIS